MTDHQSCPSADCLQQLLIESPAAPHSAELIAHLDNCAACQRLLEELAGADPALLSAATAFARTEYLEEASLRRVLDDLESDANLTTMHNPHSRAAWMRTLLSPANSPDILGLLDHYRVSQTLGHGGMGVVFKAFDPDLKRWVAIKMLAPDLARDKVARQRFAREAQAAAAVRHEHVVTIHAVSEFDGVPYLVMEYLAGGSLQEYLDRHGAPSWPAIARIGAEIASGLAAAHARGLIHRDIKPSNILLEMSDPPAKLGGVKISDFGLARIADESRLTQTGIVAGTPMYMAPEQAQCEALDHRADLFSLGSVLYTLCTGHEPYPAATAIAVLRQVCEATPQPIRQLNAAIPPWLAAIIERLHAKRPGDRFASAAEVAELLRYNLAHPDRPRMVLSPRTTGWKRRRKRLLIGGIVVALLLLVVGFQFSHSLRWLLFTGQAQSLDAQENGVRLRATLQGHQGPVWSVAFAPDGRTLATGGDDRSLRLWDPANGQQKQEPSEHTGGVLALAYAHSGKFLVSGDSDGILRLWDVSTLKQQSTIPHGSGNVRRIAISPDDGAVAVSGSAQGVELWDLNSRQLRQSLSAHHGSIQALAFAPDGKILATGDAGGDIRFWDPATGIEKAHFQADSLSVRALAFTPDGETLVSAGSGGKDMKLWRVASQQQYATLSGSEEGVLNLAMSPKGQILAAICRDGVVRFWDPRSGQALATVHAHQGRVLSLAFAPDGRTLATVGEDRQGKLWDLGGLAEIQQ